MSNPSINTEAYRQQQVEVERHEAHMGAIDRYTPVAPTEMEFLLANAERLLEAARLVLRHFDDSDPTYDDQGRAVYPPMVVPSEDAVQLHSAAHAAGGYKR